MSDSLPSEGDQGDPSDNAASRWTIRQNAQVAVGAARDTVAFGHQVFGTIRQLLQKTTKTVHHTHVRDERKTEQRTLPPILPSSRIEEILLIENSPADIALIRYALKARGLAYQLETLTQRSEVETFVRQAATIASPLPRLIITDCYLPGLEAEEIVTALRRVPAYQQVPVVLFSSLAEEEGQRRLSQCGATAFVHKPGDLAVFVEAVAMMVQRWGTRGNDPEHPPGKEHDA